MEPEPLKRIGRILRTVTYGERVHADALRLIRKAQRRHEAAPLREQVRKAG